MLSSNLKSGMDRLAAHSCIQVLLVALLSVAAAQPVPSFKDTNWDVVLFLTPLGILKNLIADSPVLRSFYLDVSKGQSPLEFSQILIMGSIYLLLLTNAFLGLQALNKRDRQ